MAYLYITEYAELAVSSFGHIVAAPLTPPVVEQPRVAIASTANPSAAFSTATRYIEVHVDNICSIAFGPSASTAAVATQHRLAANETRFYGVVPGQVLSVIVNT